VKAAAGSPGRKIKSADRRIRFFPQQTLKSELKSLITAETLEVSTMLELQYAAQAEGISGLTVSYDTLYYLPHEYNVSFSTVPIVLHLDVRGLVSLFQTGSIGQILSNIFYQTDFIK
jgi:hypothetical protein